MHARGLQVMEFGKALEVAAITVTFVGNATTLIAAGGLTVLTDPNFRLPFGLIVTMDGRQGTGLVQLLELPKAIPIHIDDYGVFASPRADFVREMTHRGLADRIIELERGASVTV